MTDSIDAISFHSKTALGDIAEKDISLQRLDEKLNVWIQTDRIFKGERFRLMYFEGSKTDESPGMQRYWYEKHRESLSSLVKIPVDAERLYASAIMILLFAVSILALAAYAWIGVFK